VSAFKDYFSAGAALYAAFRPQYPRELFAYLASAAPCRRLAWDCATGNGQAALGLAEHFELVVASDASRAQLSHAGAHPRVAYAVTRGETSALKEGCCDLVTVAQALHWLNVAVFFSEVQRVLRPGGVVAAWVYVDPELNEPWLDEVLQDYYARVEDYWPPERSITSDGYRTVPFPFEEIAAPRYEMTLSPSLEQLLGYLQTWSATKRYAERHGRNPVADVAETLRGRWGDPQGRCTLRWRLHLRVGRRPETAALQDPSFR
jgi:SAM-dependent methyltransferase